MIEKQLQRRSERDLKPQALTEDIINKLKEVSNAAASSFNAQGVSVLFITDKKLIDKFSEWNWGQEHIKKAPLFVLFLADFQRTRYAFSKNNKEFDFDNETTFDELVKTAITDATIKAQTLVDAAVMMDMGSCYIGGVRTAQEKIIKEFNLPEQVFPVLGLTIGHINTQEEIKPKMQTTFDNAYSIEEMKSNADKFDQAMTDYYSTRENNKKGTNWSSNTASTYHVVFEEKNFYKTQKELMDKKYKK